MTRDEADYKLDELAERAGVPARTIRYYVQRGLIPPPVFRGRDTSYGEGHLLRLRMIKKLQDERFLPLDAIATELASLTDDDLRKNKGSKRAGPALPPVDGDVWRRIRVRDDVELHVRSDATCDITWLSNELRKLLDER